MMVVVLMEVNLTIVICPCKELQLFVFETPLVSIISLGTDFVFLGFKLCIQIINHMVNHWNWIRLVYSISMLMLAVYKMNFFLASF